MRDGGPKRLEKCPHGREERAQMVIEIVASLGIIVSCPCSVCDNSNERAESRGDSSCSGLRRIGATAHGLGQLNSDELM